ncbi:hypothetical protein [Nocardia tengchongensis]|uniref:hypothetical protein n=1 Tax=Nocardia tengchongensis TaxID=2055889 RepID=UPI003697D284
MKVFDVRKVTPSHWLSAAWAGVSRRDAARLVGLGERGAFSASSYVFLQVPGGQRIHIVANVNCAYWWNRKGGTYKVVQGDIGSAKANTSYWF